MAGQNGGRRPGAGRKRKPTVEQQVLRRELVLDVFTPEEWRTILVEVLKQAKAGNLSVILPYLPYLLGSPRQEIKISFDVEQTTEELAEKYGVPTERVVSIVERLKAKQAG